ncbi:hypothetical protein AMAG_12891 [Allomyces macrogynus ATCC 38327]|uniref:Amino acid permease/ SLC12A domain-containing protein n=2 Tax=Allomyces macrogynus (strain ATCC 38327) TaxID=578462 RepID=A0A0L0T099_ALLM3|nr:hypothetical protein AMAG_12891 [Allomyces macrogynus ATCC 38327]|eukprot:KNE68213.1 hypothetical protein AMAG_12891 [Allomyces macrogynus ATCC 38327]
MDKKSAIMNWPPGPGPESRAVDPGITTTSPDDDNDIAPCDANDLKLCVRSNQHRFSLSSTSSSSSYTNDMGADDDDDVARARSPVPPHLPCAATSPCVRSVPHLPGSLASNYTTLLNSPSSEQRRRFLSSTGAFPMPPVGSIRRDQISPDMATATLINSNLNNLTYTSVSSNLALFEDDGSNRRPVSRYLLRSPSNNSQASKPPPPPPPAPFLGIMTGVLLPCLQNIFGIILFVRLPWVVGMAGVSGALIFLLMAVICTLTTALSMSAMVANGLHSQAGGAYYLLSRTLGREVGGAVGLMFYLSTSIAVATSILGCMEVFTNYVIPSEWVFSDPQMTARVYGFSALCLLMSALFLPPRWMHRVGFALILLVCSGLILIVVGIMASNRLVTSLPGVTGFPGHLSDNLHPGQGEPDLYGRAQDVPWTKLFALFFPCVTGIMAGVNKTGIVRRAERVIPTGTLAAIGTSTLVYAAVIVLLGTTVSGAMLRTRSYPEGLLMALLAWPHPAVGYTATVAATLGPALQCLMGSVRVLRAIAKDDILSLYWLNGRYKALGVTFTIAAAGVLAGSLDVVAPVTTMCYLLTYACINLATALFGFTNAVVWRPTFRFYHWTLSLLGGVVSLSFMFVLSWLGAVLALVGVYIVYKLLEFRGAEVNWGGEGMWSLRLQVAQAKLLDLEQHPQTPRMWRPQIIAFMAPEHNDGVAASSFHILAFLAQLKKSGGLSVVCRLLIKPFEEAVKANQIERETSMMRAMVRKFDVNAFAEVLVCASLADGITACVQSAGIGVLRPNTVVMGFPERTTDSQKIRDFVQAVRNVILFGKAVLLLRGIRDFPIDTPVNGGCIDVYWVVHDGGILALLPWLLKRHAVWRRCTLRIFAVAQMTDNSIQMKKQLVESLAAMRIDAEAIVLELGDYDISEFAYECTMNLEARQELLRSLEEAAGAPRNRSVSNLNRSMSSFHMSHNPVAMRHPPDKKKLDFMNTSVKLNQLMRQHSSDAELIFCNLPVPAPDQNAIDYLEYLDVLCHELRRIVLVKGSGMELI